MCNENNTEGQNKVSNSWRWRICHTREGLRMTCHPWNFLVGQESSNWLLLSTVESYKVNSHQIFRLYSLSAKTNFRVYYIYLFIIHAILNICLYYKICKNELQKGRKTMHGCLLSSGLTFCYHVPFHPNKVLAYLALETINLEERPTNYRLNAKSVPPFDFCTFHEPTVLFTF